MNETIPHWLSKQADTNPNHVALELYDGRTFTFRQLKEKSESYARKLARLGVNSGDKIAFLSPNSVEMVIAIHAASYLGAVIVFLNTRLTKHELTYQLTHSDATYLLSTKELLAGKGLTFNNCFTFSELGKLEEKAVPLADEINLTQPFTMMYTSGTTGAPKAVVHTYGNHFWSAISSALNLGIHKDDKWLLPLPIFHVGGFSILMRSVIYGMTVFLMEKYDRDELLHAIQQKRITIASLVTVMLSDVVASLADNALSKHVRCILLGGGAVPEPLLQKVKEKNIPLFLSYGMTETSSQIVTLSKASIHEKLGSAGKPLLSASVKIINRDENGIGEISVKGPMVFHGYYKQDEVNEEVFDNGWFRTGDLGYTDEDGFLYVVDRRKDLIISGGENIYPSEIENVLLNHPCIKEVAVVAKKDERWGQVPVAFIVVNEAISKEDVIEFARRSLANYKLPKKIFFKNALPRTASNKIIRFKLQQEADQS